MNRSFTVDLSASVGDRHLDLYSVKGTDIIADCAEVGAQIQRRLVSQVWIDGANARADVHLDEEQDNTDEDPIQSANGETSDETVSDEVWRR